MGCVPGTSWDTCEILRPSHSHWAKCQGFKKRSLRRLEGAATACQTAKVPNIKCAVAVTNSAGSRSASAVEIFYELKT